MKPYFNKNGEIRILISFTLIMQFCKQIGLEYTDLTFIPLTQFNDEEAVHFLVRIFFNHKFAFF